MNREIVDYTVVMGDGTILLCDTVKKYIQKGRQPLGGVFVSLQPGVTMCMQAMVKYAPLPITDETND